LTVQTTFPKDRWIVLALIGVAGSVALLRPHPVSLERLFPAVAEAPHPLGSLEPKGRTNPDGSEVWGYPAGSGLEDLVEVHVKDGRVVREVLRPRSQISEKAFTD